MAGLPTQGNITETFKLNDNIIKTANQYHNVDVINTIN